jgi:translation initiation factor 3 subunit F
MLKLHQMTSPKESVVGWFTTDDSLSYISTQLHKVYQQKVSAAAKRGQAALLLTVDVTLKNFELGVKGYVGKFVHVGDKEVTCCFESVGVKFSPYSAEQIGVDALINGYPDDQRLDAPATVLSPFESLELSMGKLLDMLGTTRNYVAAVNDKDVKADPKVGRAIANAINSIPYLEASGFEGVFNDHVRDLLMVTYLANFTKTQLCLADKISGIL